MRQVASWRSACLCLAFACVFGAPFNLLGQATTKAPGSFDFDADGIVFQTADTAHRVLMRFRFQNHATTRTSSLDALDIGSTEWMVRRLRLRFGGHLADRRLTFNLQLSFARNDQDFSDTQFPHVVRDAMIFWNFTPDLQIGFGQTKLPGNRQRVISSGDLQIGERSIVNNAFNLDRDFGFQGFWRLHIDDVIINMRGALSTGDGRNQARIAGDGLAWTGRVEVLPLGAFTNGGDYFEGDLMREPTPKVSIGATIHDNKNHNRTRGQLGVPLFQQRSSSVVYLDAIAKWQGAALYGEYAKRTAADPITRAADGRTASVLVGTGWMAQASYIFPANIEIAARVANVTPDDVLAEVQEREQNDYSLAATYYLRSHRIKGGLEVGQERRRTLGTSTTTGNWLLRANVEVGI
jgi:hypothetical protein